MTYTAVFFVNGLAPFFGQDGPEAALRDAAERVGLDTGEIRPLRHKSRRLALWDRHGNLIAVAVPIRSPF